LRTGLFPNFDRIKFLRARIPDDKLRNSAIRVIMTATDIQRGAARFFSNATVETLVNDPGAHEDFIRREVESPQDLVLAAVASSAYTFAYEAVTMEGRLWTDGGIMTNQPVLPALRLGADVLFLVLIAPLEGADQTGAIKTFLDVGVHAVDILISKNHQHQSPVYDLCRGNGRKAGTTRIGDRQAALSVCKILQHCSGKASACGGTGF